MELTADHVSVAGLHGPLLLPTTLVARPGHVTLVAGDPGHGHVALALALGGRVSLAEGVVALDGRSDEDLRRRHVALVDVPNVTAPEDAVSVRSAIAEQLALAGRPASRGATRAFLTGHGVEGRRGAVREPAAVHPDRPAHGGGRDPGRAPACSSWPRRTASVETPRGGTPPRNGSPRTA